MSIPVVVEPLIEPEAEWPHRRTLSRWVRSAPVFWSLAVVSIVALWADVAREEIWPGLPGPFEPGSAYGGYALVFLAGCIAGCLRPQVSRTIADTLPRLPVFLRFDGRRVVVVGGGTTAAAKIPALLAAGARVTVIAPAVGPGIERMPVQVRRRRFLPADLDGAWFVTAAATPEVNAEVRAAAEGRHIFVNAVDDPVNATAYLGGTLQRGGVTVAFSTAGQAPALAGLLREAFDELLPADIGAWVGQAHVLRQRQRERGVPMVERRPELLAALNRLYDSRTTARHEST
jgi:siroheme synthase-like protein